MNPAEKEFQPQTDPIVQERDYSNGPGKESRSSEIVLSAEEIINPPHVTPWPNRLMRAGGSGPSVPLANDILGSFLRFKWTVLFVFLLVSAPAIAIIWMQIVPKYRARAEVRVRPIVPHLVFRTDENGAIPFYDSFVNTQVSYMRSSTVLQRVLDQPAIRQTQWYKNPRSSLMQRFYGNKAPPLERLRDTLSVRPRQRTEIIDVDFVDPSANEAKLIVDTVLEQYIRYIAEMSNENEEELYRQLSERHTSLRSEIQGHEEFVANLSKTLGTATPGELVSSKRVRLDQTKARLNELKQSIALLEWKKKALIDDSNNVAFASSPAIQSEYSDDEEWRKLDYDVRAMKLQIANSGLTSKHPDMIRMEKNLEFVEESLRLRQMQLNERWHHRPQDVPGTPSTIAQWRNQTINVLGAPVTIANSGMPDLDEDSAGVERQLAQTKHEEQLLAAEIDKQQVEFDTLFATAQSLEKANNDLNHKRDLFEAVRQRMDQKTMERDIPPSIEVLSKAFVPSQPHSDRRMVFMAMALILGVGAGGGMGLLRANRRQTVYVPDDMPYAMQVPFLGYVPVLPVRRFPQKPFGKSLCEQKYAQDRMAESIRLVRTALLSRLGGPRNTALLITSAVAGTGKSYFTMTLGESLARAGKKVLMIDADLRKMGLTRRFNLAGKAGFIESLRSRSADKRHIFPTDTFGLNIMPAGKHNDGAVIEETANGAFKACMSQLRQWYDFILLDSTPILPVADAMILSSQVDGTIMVERELVSQRGTQIDALMRLTSGGGQLLGTVFVGSSDSKDYRYSSAY
ncbi:MAG: hypothetical protein A2Z25_06060 [Planctomycetes bacterium RBG_16_55_9]|nr:MAG: hypothetical protein A2Z25_06060 [Planctomycetes bacterium RBG_16_55_9]